MSESSTNTEFDQAATGSAYTRTTADTLLEDLRKLREEFGPGVTHYFIGSLSTRLSDLGDGPEIWAASLSTARDCAVDARNRSAVAR